MGARLRPKYIRHDNLHRLQDLIPKPVELPVQIPRGKSSNERQGCKDSMKTQISSAFRILFLSQSPSRVTRPRQERAWKQERPNYRGCFLVYVLFVLAATTSDIASTELLTLTWFLEEPLTLFGCNEVRVLKDAQHRCIRQRGL